MIRDETIGRTEFFFEKKIVVHIGCIGGQFYNGLITEIVGSDFLVINDRMLGETPVYFSQIKMIERFVEVRE